MKNFFTLTLLVTLFMGCSSDNDNDNADKIVLNTSDLTMYYDDEIQIDAKSDSKISYSSQNEYYASVSDGGVIKAGRVGETRIALTNGKDTKSLKVTIRAKRDLYPEPNIEFGISRSDLIKKLGTPDNETVDGIGYYNYSINAPQVAYLFDSNDQLRSSAVLVNSTQSSSLGSFLAERYLSIGSKDYTFFYINSLLSQKPTMGVGATLSNINYWMVLYMPFSDTQEKNTFNSDSEMKKKLENIFR